MRPSPSCPGGFYPPFDVTFPPHPTFPPQAPTGVPPAPQVQTSEDGNSSEEDDD